MRDKILFEKEFEYKIISADLSADGMLSVVTSAQRYASQLHVFDSDYQEEIVKIASDDEIKKLIEEGCKMEPEYVNKLSREQQREVISRTFHESV